MLPSGEKSGRRKKEGTLSSMKRPWLDCFDSPSSPMTFGRSRLRIVLRSFGLAPLALLAPAWAYRRTLRSLLCDTSRTFSGSQAHPWT